MENFGFVIGVLTLLIALLAVADRFRLPYPVVLVVGGLCIGFIPSMPVITLNPEVVFFLFLPPILFNSASNTSWHDFKAEIKPISTLAIALVFFTTITVAIASHILIPGFTWALAFVLGAIVSPPDAVAATSITKGLGLNKRVVTIIEGESLINDASALIAYRFAITAIGTGTFVFWQAGANFLLVASGGIISGIVIGYIFIFIHKKVPDNSLISTSLTLLTPFIAYLAAERFHTSGVLAVVTSGLVMSWRASDVFSYQTRIRNKAVWDTLIFLLNGFIFILIGLQLPSILADLEMYSLQQLLYYGSIVSVVTIAVRILWVFAGAFSTFGKGPSDTGNNNTWKNVSIVAWTGTRGVVSMATALALPLTLADGTTFPQRSLILFLAFVVIFATLVIQGMSLPLLIKLLGVNNNQNPNEDVRELQVVVASSIVNFLETEFPYEINNQVKEQLKKKYIGLVDSLSKRSVNHFEPPDSQSAIKLTQFLKAQLEIYKFERNLLIRYHKEGRFNQTAIRRLEQELDVAEWQINHVKKKRKQFLD